MMNRWIMLIIMVLLPSCAGTRTLYPAVGEEELQQEQEYQHKLAAQALIRTRQASQASRLKQQARLNRVGAAILEGGVQLCTDGAFNDSQSLCLYEFVLQEEGNEANAAADGSTITISPAMMRRLPTDEALAVVLGHEYAHNLMRHPEKIAVNTVVGGTLGRVVDHMVGAQGIPTYGVFNRLGQGMTLLHYSPDMEREADYVGMYVTALAGYKVDQAPRIWREMTQRDKKASAIYTTTTHPTNPERYLALQKTAREIAGKQKKGRKLVPELVPELVKE